MWPGGDTPGPKIAAHMQPASNKAIGPVYLRLYSMCRGPGCRLTVRVVQCCWYAVGSRW